MRNKWKNHILVYNSDAGQEGKIACSPLPYQATFRFRHNKHQKKKKIRRFTAID